MIELQATLINECGLDCDHGSYPWQQWDSISRHLGDMDDWVTRILHNEEQKQIRLSKIKRT